MTHRNKTVGKITNLLLVVWLVSMPLFWQFDLARGTSDYYDSFSMAPYATVHIVVFYALIFASVYLNGFSFWHILLLGLYFLFVQLVNFPYFTIRDVFLHGGPAEQVVANGRLAPVAGSSALSNPSLEAAWPGSYFLQGMFMEVTGLGVIVSNYILYFIMMVIVLLVIYSFFLLLRKRNYSLGWAGALLFLALFFNYSFDNFHHYSRTTFAFTLYFMFVFVFLCFENRPGMVLSLMLFAAITISHPFQSLALMVFVIIYVILIGKSRSKTISLAWFSITFFVAWMLFQAPAEFSDTIGRFGAFFSSEYATPLAQSLNILQTVPWWGEILRNYFKYTLVALLLAAFLASLLVFFKSKTRTRVSIGLTSIFLSAIMMLFSLLLLPQWQVSRFTAFAAFPAAFSPLVLVAGIRKTGKARKAIDFLGKRFMLILLLLFIASFSAGSMVLRFESNHYFGELYHPSEMASLSFFFTNNNNSTLFIVSWRTYIYSEYFNYNYSHEVSMIWVTDLTKFADNSSGLLSDYSQQINESQFALRGMRDSFTIMSFPSFPNGTILGAIDQEILIPRFNQVYSNGNYALYGRAGT